jgi:Glutamyl-tRNAGlu reductase, dimerisation domain
MTLGPDSVERIRRHEVSRALKKTNLSPDDKEVIDLFSRSLVGRLLHGPISEILARAEFSFGDRPGQGAPRGLERYGDADKIPRAQSDSRMCENGKPYVELASDHVSGRPA